MPEEKWLKEAGEGERTREISEDTGECKRCGGKGIIKEPDGQVHVCYDCLAKGKMDQHDKNPKTAEDYRIKL